MIKIVAYVRVVMELYMCEASYECRCHYFAGHDVSEVLKSTCWMPLEILDLSKFWMLSRRLQSGRLDRSQTTR